MLTRFLAKLMGLWIVLTVLGMVMNRGATIAAVDALFADPGLMLIAGIFTLVIGLAVVIGHNHWSGGALPVVVTLYGWAALLKGLLFICLPLSAQAGFYQALHFQRFFFGYFVIALVLGVYLIYGGFWEGERSTLR
ncbi:MAG: hypothetical protein WCB01_12000 [Candidatus Cybelea sp.]